MDYTEIIEREALKYSEEKWKHPSSNLSRAHCSLDFEAGIKSELAKQITEIEKLTALITNNKGVLQFDMPEASKEGIRSVIEAQTTLRDKLINELKLK